MDAKISSQNQNQNKVLHVSTTLYPQFKLPDDWVVGRRCRSKRGNRRRYKDKGSVWRATLAISPNMVSNTVVLNNDWYPFGAAWKLQILYLEVLPANCMLRVEHYIEPETGKRFHSLRSVSKNLTEVKEHTATLEALKAGDHFSVSKE
ncbi:unnamed protein product [Dovyalis caffra]|uniref:Uncharacterized protein n=1 Tax=Dovyalis caffra TaxID=77055 RepID=A0AAV1RD03_9ROSI|nr:unnamed protein product [Dovyalis caffra]